MHGHVPLSTSRDEMRFASRNALRARTIHNFWSPYKADERANRHGEETLACLVKNDISIRIEKLRTRLNLSNTRCQLSQYLCAIFLFNNDGNRERSITGADKKANLEYHHGFTNYYYLCKAWFFIENFFSLRIFASGCWNISLRLIFFLTRF